MIKHMAQVENVQYKATLTGINWIGNRFRRSLCPFWLWGSYWVYIYGYSV